MREKTTAEMKIREYESYMHCVVCGKYVGNDYKLPHGAQFGKYCEHCAAGVHLPPEYKYMFVRRDVQEIAKRHKNRENLKKIGESYDVSASFIQTTLMERL